MLIPSAGQAIYLNVFDVFLSLLQYCRINVLLFLLSDLNPLWWKKFYCNSANCRSKALAFNIFARGFDMATYKWSGLYPMGLIAANQKPKGLENRL